MSLVKVPKWILYILAVVKIPLSMNRHLNMNNFSKPFSEMICILDI
jgi:hypothetical protein